MSRPAGATPERVHDLTGNVSEWVADRYGDHSSADATDPTGPASGALRVLRGGSFSVIPRGLRAASRIGSYPASRYVGIGFRVVWSAAEGQN